MSGPRIVLPSPTTVHDMRPDRSKPADVICETRRIDSAVELRELIAARGPVVGFDKTGTAFLAELAPTGILFTTPRGTQPTLPLLVMHSHEQQS